MIINLDPGAMIPKDMLQNAYHNNPHGFGLVLRDANNKRIQVIKKTDKYDVNEISDLLYDNADIHRYLHLRWKTEGPIDENNTHPFSIYNSDKDNIVFMHNGTLHSYKPSSSPHNVNGVKTDDPVQSATHSDTRRFAEEVLEPLMLTVKGNLGGMTNEIIHKYWSANNRGLLVSAQQGALLIQKSEWKTIKFKEGEEERSFLASNDTYFDKVTRGPEYDRRKEEADRKEKEEKARRFQGTNTNREVVASGWTVSKLGSKEFLKKSDIQEKLSKILMDHDLYTAEGMANLSHMRIDEIETLMEKDSESVIQLIVLLSDEVTTLLDRYNRLKEFLESGKAHEQEKQKAA